MDWIGHGVRQQEPAQGATATADIVVARADLASELALSDDECFPAVYATSRMVALMELASARVLAPYLKAGELSVGVTVEITHAAATPPGTMVGADARYRGRDGRLFVFDVVARDEGGEIGRGVHRRAIVSTERLLAGARKRVAAAARIVAVAVAALVGGRSASAQMPAPRSPDTVTVTPGAEYGASWLHRVFLGTRYRHLWQTPVDVPVLDLARFDGGLTVTRLGGGQQTSSLRFTSAAGTRYTFRAVRKDPTGILRAELRNTIVEDILVDQMSAGFPYGAAVVDRLLPAAEAPSLSPVLYVLPDDPRLGDFRERFAGELGFLERQPTSGRGGDPTIGGFTSIITTEEMIQRRRGRGEAVDAAGYLAARLLDLYVGDWDRHRDQWRWGRLDPTQPWRPIPRDRDQAFARFDGLLLAAARQGAAPQLVKFESGSIPIEGLTWNGRDLDRELLPRLDRHTWDSVVTAVTGRLTDARIRDAVGALPASAANEAAWLETALFERRERLAKAADEFHRRLARETELHATDGRERIAVVGLEDGRVRLTIDGDQAGMRVERTFDPAITREVRLYLHRGADSVTVAGTSSGILVRLIDDAGESAVLRRGGPEVRVYHDGAVTRPAPAPGSNPPPRDWGSRSMQFPVLASSPDAGVVIGRGLTRYDYGFGKEPYASRISIQAAFGTGNARPGLEVGGDIRTSNRAIRLRFEAKATGVEPMRYYGAGNETVEAADPAFHRILNWQFGVATGLEIVPDRRLSIRVGPSIRFVDAEPDTARLIGQDRPMGAAGYGIVSGVAAVTWDSRDVPANPRRGVLVAVRGELAPAAWDVEDAFGSVAAEARTYWSPAARGGPTLALRAGGSRAFGDYPFFEAATVGGSETIRGYAQDRFRGETAVYGGAELRVPVGGVKVVIPGTLGVLGFADGGRVYQDGESSSTWHTGFGGGLYLSWLGQRNTVSATVGRSPERTAFYLKLGMAY